MIIKDLQSKMLEIAATWVPWDVKRVIEVGCNNGNFAALLEPRRVKNYIGIDIQEDKIEEAKELHPKFKFICADITKNLHFLQKASMVLSFQCLEHIKDDLMILNNIQPGTLVVLSVPNGSYKGHYRWYEADGWEDRFSPYIDIIKFITVQNPRKHAKRSFLIKGVRNDYVDRKTYKFPMHVSFSNMMGKMRRREE